ncbi:hypothetical protein B0H14DRAFT_2971068 [Mycena olivaceomarginata]|nr:hypothetical protein B0H14DRAFT_2971068 [Mycena olivaceomarginata]
MKIQLHFVVVGAGVAGLSCAIALRRIGHRVTVIEMKHNVTGPQHQRGVRMPPNLTKILFHWGLKERVRAISVKSEAVDIMIDRTGELLGTQVWDEEILRETRGEDLFGHLSDLVTLLYDEAIRLGSEILLGTMTTSIDPEQGKITTDVSGTLRADVIIGADGIAGLARRILLDEQEHKTLAVSGPGDRPSMWMYSATIPKQVILNNAEVNGLYGQEHNTLFIWLGNGRSAVGYALGGTDDFSLIAYGPYDAERLPFDGIRHNLEGTEPRLKHLLPLISDSLRRQPVIKCEPLEDWVSHHGRLLLVGTAAHPIPKTQCRSRTAPSSGRLFSHLRSRDQVNQFLWAFQDIRQPRCAAATERCTTCISRQEARDAGLRAKLAAGVQVLQAGGDQEETPEWREVREIFGYDAEDEADDWWVGWGSLKYGSAEYGSIGIQVEQTVSN